VIVAAVTLGPRFFLASWADGMNHSLATAPLDSPGRRTPMPFFGSDSQHPFRTPAATKAA
jgi:hypothetical protein